MKILVINGSPRKDGDTAQLIRILKNEFCNEAEVTEISAYYGNFNPCYDCRACFKTAGCVIRDDFDRILDDSFDCIVIASPVYNGSLPGPMINIQNRFQFSYANRRFAKLESPIRRAKIGVLILIGGGDGKPTEAVKVARFILGKTGAKLTPKNKILYLHTDEVPAIDDKETVQKIKELAKRLSNK